MKTDLKCNSKSCKVALKRGEVYLYKGKIYCKQCYNVRTINLSEKDRNKGRVIYTA
jgi:hypothetical protein